jgi:hypothetical protein
MKKYLILLVIIIVTGVTSILFAQKDRKLSNGFSICLVTGFPSDVYGYPNDSQIDAADKLGGIWGLKLGNRWYFKPKENYGFGLMVNWLDFSIAMKSYTFNGSTSSRAVGDFSFLQFGPVGTYAVSSDIALDAYFNFRPTVFEHIIIPSSGDTDGYGGVGFSYALGAAFRYRVLNIGIEYVMGGINCDYLNMSSSSGINTTDTQKLMTNSFRILLGVKL